MCESMAAEFSMSLRVLVKERLASGGRKGVSGTLTKSACLRICCKLPTHFHAMQLRSVTRSPEGGRTDRMSNTKKQGSLPRSRMSRHSTEDIPAD
mmetsp:Transcript_1549/g.9540  ORF Transcript_1549/g.9540 Transcript_1549/m.9540 type:complete len:95 (+) Transcript_1549:1123-1407(+)